MTLPNQKVKNLGGRPPGKRVTSLHVAVPFEVRDVIERYAAARDMSMSKAVTELLVASMPAIERLIEAVQVVEKAPGEAAELVRRSLDKAISDATGAREQLDLLSTKKGGSSGPKM